MSPLEPDQPMEALHQTLAIDDWIGLFMYPTNHYQQMIIENESFETCIKVSVLSWNHFINTVTLYKIVDITDESPIHHNPTKNTGLELQKRKVTQKGACNSKGYTERREPTVQAEKFL